MSRSKKRQLDSVVAAIQRQHGARAIRKGNTVPQKQLPDQIGTSFPQLDAITGCCGIPVGHLTLFTGPLGSGKLTIAYKVLMKAQQKRSKKSKQKHAVAAILNLNQQVNVDYLHRCQVDLKRLDIYQPAEAGQSVDLLLDLVAGNYYRAIVVDSLSDLLAVPKEARRLERNLSKLNRLLRATQTSLICIGEQNAPWLARWLSWDQLGPVRRTAALHVDFMVHEWLHEQGKWRGYRRTATVRKSRWGRPGRQAAIDIEFNGTVRAREPW